MKMQKTRISQAAPTGTVKRSLTVGKDVDEQVRNVAGAGGYSAFMNDAAVMALQARGIREWLVDFEARYGAISEDEVKDARRRRAAAAASARR